VLYVSSTKVRTRFFLCANLFHNFSAPKAASVPHCDALTYAIGACFVIAVPSSSALFFFRVRAIYYNNSVITYFFGFLWASLLVLCFLVPIGVRNAHLGTTQRCIVTHVDAYASAPLVLNAVFDTLIFVAISVRISSFTTVGDTFYARCASFFRGEGLSNVSRRVHRNVFFSV
jgi:hypothetical protein